MALRNQPYIPLYIQDFLTDEKLMECSAEATGVYIRIMCIMHKSDEYGTILLKQKDKQGSDVDSFSRKLTKHLPYDYEVIHRGLSELLEEGVLAINDCKLLQKRMMRDNDISIKRADAGSKGGFATQFALAKSKANYENENETENETENKDKRRFVKPTIKEIYNYCEERNNKINANKFYSYYESIGWKVGKSPMKCWKSAIRTWEQRDDGVKDVGILLTKQQRSNLTQLAEWGKEQDAKGNF